MTPIYDELLVAINPTVYAGSFDPFDDWGCGGQGEQGCRAWKFTELIDKFGWKAASSHREIERIRKVLEENL